MSIPNEVKNKQYGAVMSIQSSGKIINNRYLNFKDWCNTFTHSGVNKTDGKRLVNTPYYPVVKL